MGYNPSKKAVEDMKVVLDFMLEHQNVDFKYPSVAPDKLAYAVRRALHGVKAFPKSYPQYQPLLDRFTMKERGDYVLFTRRISLVSGSPTVVTPEGLAANRELSIESVSTPMQIVGALIKHKADSMRFPDAATDTESLSRIYKWSSTNGYFMELASTGLLITRTKPVQEWQPST